MTRLSTLPALLALAFAAKLSAQADRFYSVYLLGNLADVADGAAYLQQFQTLAKKGNGQFTLVLDGDLASDSVHREAQVKTLLDLADMVENQCPNGRLLVVPGDRDWNGGRRGGEKFLENLEKEVKDYFKYKGYKRCRWAVSKGCPGPEVYEVSNSLAILALNTQWWNHPFDKPRPTDGICDALTPENLKEELQDAVEAYADRNVLIVGHHPVYSLGNYGGRFSFGEQFKPFPVAGTFRTAFRANVGTAKDLANHRLQVFVEGMNNLLFFHSNLIYASGHEQNQQIILRGNNFLVNSGAPVSAKYAASDPNTVFSKKAAGVMELMYYQNGRVDARFHSYNPKNGFGETQIWTLLESGCETDGGTNTAAKTDTPLRVNVSYMPCKTEPANDETGNAQRGTVEVVAGEEYAAGGWKRFWLGNHYRTSWTTPVKTTYLDLDHTYGGLTIFKKGGGRQTTSLKFKSADGSEYTFRSVNKDPATALNYQLRQTFVAGVLRDQTSTENPYGALAVAPLLDKIGILHASPRLYVLPDDPALGPFRAKYANLFGMLEESPGKPNSAGRHFGDASNIEQSSKLFERLYKRKNVKVDEREFVRARLFDILAGDWSKHEDNWKWAACHRDGFTVYRPIPRDRDHVFSRQDGVIPWLADRKFGLPNLENFDYTIHDLRSLTWQARHMDRFLTAGVPKEVFLEQAKFIRQKITEADIEAAVRNMPLETYEKSGRVIEAKLKRRIQDLPEYAEAYYRQLSKEVDVPGTNEDEFFEVQYLNNGSVQVRKYESAGGAKGGPPLFERTFDPDETKEVRIWGLGGKDVFDLHSESPSAKTSIRVRAFGGTGDDVFMDKAPVKTLLYDKGDSTQYQIGGQAKVAHHWNREVYEFDRQRFEYNRFLPLILLGYSRYSGFGINAGGILTIRKFGKEGYHSRHSFRAGYTTNSNKSVQYLGRFHHTFRRWDLLVNGFYADPDYFNYFFGLGNSSVKDDDLSIRFYDAAVKRGHFSLGVARDFWQKSSFSLKTGYEQDNSVRLENTFLASQTGIFGAEGKLTILPVEAALDFDFRDRKGLPYRGVRTLIGYRHGTILNGDNENYGVAEGSLEYYLSTRAKHPLTLGLRAGGALTHGEAPWYKLPTLGDANGLRGFYENRFTGERTAYFNTELRYQLFEKYTSFVPLKMGVKVFYDRGRVFFDGAEEDDTWHEGYGFGLYLVPLNEAYTLSLSVGFSEEESVYPVFSLGAPLR